MLFWIKDFFHWPSISFLVVLLFPAFVSATIRYVDKDDAGCGTGTLYCTIAAAIAAASAGDFIRIRDASTAYSEEDINIGSGSSGSPITIEPDTGNNPTLTCTTTSGWVSIFHTGTSSWITIQNLTFSGSGVTHTCKAAIHSNSSDATVAGIIIQGNTFTDWGGTNQGDPNGTGVTNAGMQAINLTHVRGANAGVPGVTIQNNTITGPIYAGVAVNSGGYNIIQNNQISGVRCGILTSDSYLEENGIKLGSDVDHVVVRNNHIYDSQTATACVTAVPNAPAFPGTVIMSGIYGDAGGYFLTIEKNRIHGITASGDSGGAGIFIESTLEDNIIQNNAIYDTNLSGVRLSSGGCSSNLRNSILNNSIRISGSSGNGGWGIYVWDGVSDATIKNNVVWTDSLPPINVTAAAVTCGGHVLDYNLYYQSGSSNIGSWSGTTYTSLASWRTNSGGDANAVTGDPSFTSATNLYLQQGSPAINEGVTIGGITDDIAGTGRPQGSAYEIGAYEFIEEATRNRAVVISNR